MPDLPPVPFASSLHGRRIIARSPCFPVCTADKGAAGCPSSFYGGAHCLEGDEVVSILNVSECVEWA
jgi:hypothetical protein